MRHLNAQLIGASPQLRELMEEIERVSTSDAKVLITGESGAGKELVARAIHAGSPRAREPFVPINCAGIPETLLESELFGHVKGSFTGAYRDKPGKLEYADKGTVFLDEIGEMTVRMQGLLLRFLETGELQKVGADRASGARERPGDCGDPPRSADDDCRRAVSRGPVLPAQRHPPGGAAASRAPRGHPRAGRATSSRGSPTGPPW